MNAETRAKELYDRLFCIGEYRTAKVPIYPMAIIASALRQAENDKLEEAARICDDLFDHYSMSDHCEQAARNIRSLKSKETP